MTGKPTAFRGFVDDVFHRDGKTYVRFLSLIATPGPAYFVFELECSRSIVDTVITQTSDYPRFVDEYAVVANIQEVSKAVVALEPTAYSIGSGEYEELDIEIDISPSRLFIARGICIELAYNFYRR